MILTKLIAVKPSLAILDWPAATNTSLSNHAYGTKIFNVRQAIHIGPIADVATCSDERIQNEKVSILKAFNRGDATSRHLEGIRLLSPITYSFLRALQDHVPEESFNTCHLYYLRPEWIHAQVFPPASLDWHCDGDLYTPSHPADGREWITMRFMAQTGPSRTQYLAAKNIWAKPSFSACEEDENDPYFYELQNVEPYVYTPDSGSLLLIHSSHIHRARYVSPGWRYFMSGYLTVPLDWIESIENRITFPRTAQAA